MDRDAILLTPGPLTTTVRTKLAMLRDWGSWDADSIAMTAELRRELLAIVAWRRHRTSSCPCRAAAPSRSRRQWRPSCRATATCSCSTTAPTASGIGRLATLMGRRTTIMARRRTSRLGRRARCARLSADPSITHVGLIHCETGTGVLNPLQEIADVCARPARA